jgi:hypothetical protein
MTNATKLAPIKLYTWVPIDVEAAPVNVIGAVVVAFCCVRSVDVAWVTEEVVVRVKKVWVTARGVEAGGV